MTYGPIDFIALKFKGNKFKGEGLKALNDLMKKKIVRVIDLVIIVKDKEGKLTVKEIQEPDPEFIAIFDPTKVKATHGMIKKDDIDLIGKELENNSTAALMLFENLGRSSSRKQYWKPRASRSCLHVSRMNLYLRR